MGLFTPLYLKSNLTPQKLEKARARIAATTDQDRLGEIAREAPEAPLRQAAVEKLQDQALLARIAGGDEAAVVREAAARKLDDDGVLARIARTDGSTQVRQAAARRVKGDALLAELARNSADEEVRVIAVSRMNDLVPLTEIARGADSARVRSEAVYIIKGILQDGPDKDRDKKLDAVADPAVLERVLERMRGTDANWKCRTAIIGRLTNQATLKRIAREDPAAVVRASAARGLTDPSTLAEIATQDGDSNVRQAALRNAKLLSDPVFMDWAVLDAAYSEDVRCAIAERGLTDPGVLSRVADQSESPRIRLAAIRNPRFDDPALLGRLAREDESADVRRAAVESKNLEDPALMAKIALEDKSMGVRCAAIPRVEDAQVLAQIAGDSALKDRSPRFLAALRLSRLDAARAVGPLVELIGEDHYSLTHCRHYDYEHELREAMDFLKKAYREGVSPENGKAIKGMDGRRYGQSGYSGCLHADYRVHFDLAR